MNQEARGFILMLCLKNLLQCSKRCGSHQSTRVQKLRHKNLSLIALLGMPGEQRLRHSIRGSKTYPLPPFPDHISLVLVTGWLTWVPAFNAVHRVVETKYTTTKVRCTHSQWHQEPPRQTPLAAAARTTRPAAIKAPFRKR